MGAALMRHTKTTVFLCIHDKEGLLKSEKRSLESVHYEF